MIVQNMSLKTVNPSCTEITMVAAIRFDCAMNQQMALQMMFVTVAFWTIRTIIPRFALQEYKGRYFYFLKWVRLALCVIFMIFLVLLENDKKYVLSGCTITSKAKINVF